MRSIALGLVLALAGCHRSSEATAAPSGIVDCGATRGDDLLEITRAPSSEETPRQCFKAAFERCAPATMSQSGVKKAVELRGEVVLGDGGCLLEWSGEDGKGPLSALCHAIEVVHRVTPGTQEGRANQDTDRLLAKDCSDGRPHLL